uniref:hypothetical protein n=1 Tax=Amycolatopsis sp. CA-096443 TaxID=3239919 RepID=UPI003F49537D
MPTSPNWPPIDLLPLTKLFNEDGSVPELEAEFADSSCRFVHGLPNDAEVINPIVGNYLQRMHEARRLAREQGQAPNPGR